MWTKSPGSLPPGDYEQALQVPFPSLALGDHISAIADALKECPRLAAQLAEQWKKIYQNTSSDLGQTGSAIDKAQAKLYSALTDLKDTFAHLSDAAQNDLDAVTGNPIRFGICSRTIPILWATRHNPL